MAAAKGNKYAEGNEGGRPTDYRREFAKKAKKLCLLGATDNELADFFEVTEQTINNWKETHKEFFDALKKGKAQADANVASRLYQRAIGYSHKDVDIRVVEGTLTTTNITKHYPPDTV